MEYKLIKKYPGSPELGYTFSMYDGYKGDYHLYPEFWEPVQEKTYEVLKIRHNNSFKVEPIEVKRLSDGEIFKVGDEVESNLGRKYTIESFTYQGNDGNIYASGKTNNSTIYASSKASKDTIYHAPITCIKKVEPTCVFESEDGYKIYHGSVVHRVNKINYDIRTITITIMGVGKDYAAKGSWFEVEEKCNNCKDWEFGKHAICENCNDNGFIKKSYNIYKDPVTDDGTKISRRGLLSVVLDDSKGYDEPKVLEECTWEEESQGLLQTIYEDGEFYNQTTLSEIRKRVLNNE